MKSRELYNGIINLLDRIKDDEGKLESVLELLENEILEEKRMKEIKLSPEMEALFNNIIENLDAGYTVFLDPDTLRTELVSTDDFFSSEEYDEQHEDKLDEFEMARYQWENVVEFKPYDKDEKFVLMEDFTKQLKNQRLARTLADALARQEPIEAFQTVLDDDPDTQLRWDKFKKSAIENYVLDLMSRNLPLDM